MIKSDKMQLTFVATGFLTVLLYNVLLLDVSLTLMLAILGVGVSIFGIPHGAIDGYLVQKTGFTKDLKSACAFVVAYVLISGLVVGAWFLAPDAMFLIFIITTAWHFGEDGGAQKPLDRMLFGSCIIALPALFHSNSTAELFQLLSITNSVDFVGYMQTLGPILALASMTLSLLRKSSVTKTTISAVTILAIVFFAYALPPLLFFTVYFCALHSPRHFKSIAVAVPRQERRNFICLTIIYTLATIVLASAAFWLLISYVVFDQAFVLVIFVGLAALTVPHMILVDGIWVYCQKKLA